MSSTIQYCEPNTRKFFIFIKKNLNGAFDFNLVLCATEFDQEVNTKSAEKSNYIENSFSSDKNEFYSKRKCENPSPTTVLDVCEGESQSTEEDCSSLAESCITNNFSSSGSLESKRKPQIGKPMRILKQISYFFRSPVYWPGGNRNGSSLKGKHQALLRCFTYQQIANATNNFHAGKMKLYLLLFSIIF